MRKKRAIILACVCAVCIAIYLLGLFYGQYVENKLPISYTDKVMGIAITNDSEFLQEKEKKLAKKNPGVCFEGVLLPYDAGSQTLFLPQSLWEEKWTGSLSLQEAKGGFLCAPEDILWQNKNAAIKDGHTFTVWLVEADVYYEFQLSFPGMPMICMETEREEEPEQLEWNLDSDIDPDKVFYESETLFYGKINVLDPGRTKEDSIYRIHQSNMRYHYKGASTSYFEKKGYALSLQDYQGNNVDASLLGMRSDNSWKLNALNTDVNRIREKTAAQIWERFDEADETVNEPGPKMEYVELVVDNDYKGLYCLVEPVDSKKLNLDRNDVLYKAIGWEAPPVEEIQISIQKGWKIYSSLRIRYPKEIADYAVAWNPICDYLSMFYENPEMNFEEALSRVDVKNLSDMLMFTMVTSASDNFYKNTYFAASVAPDGSYVMKQLPWDLDYTFGNIYAHGVINSVLFDASCDKVYEEISLPKLKRLQPEQIGLPFLERWQDYRKDFLDTENILKMLQDNRQYIMETGAVKREMKRWPDAGVDVDIEYLLDFQAQRMEWLDEYFASWAIQTTS